MSANIIIAYLKWRKTKLHENLYSHDMPPVRSYVSIHRNESEPHRESEAYCSSVVLQVEDEHQIDGRKVVANRLN